ncbi:translation initiation factor IF-2-like [Lutra lutra]|uniref:translation initiation factor IF-2-like n=1 Tax=Lutra lutra TaxID=9657 RepID=UPI001FD2153E|nr:translation initiation factor IF-2-like [Lutra lutra]XP_047593040.1 translation initiation factor IF-2-like [Lutra lutra]
MGGPVRLSAARAGGRQTLSGHLLVRSRSRGGKPAPRAWDRAAPSRGCSRADPERRRARGGPRRQEGPGCSRGGGTPAAEEAKVPKGFRPRAGKARQPGGRRGAGAGREGAVASPTAQKRRAFSRNDGGHGAAVRDVQRALTRSEAIPEKSRVPAAAEPVPRGAANPLRSAAARGGGGGGGAHPGRGGRDAWARALPRGLRCPPGAPFYRWGHQGPWPGSGKEGEGGALANPTRGLGDQGLAERRRGPHWIAHQIASLNDHRGVQWSLELPGWSVLRKGSAGGWTQPGKAHTREGLQMALTTRGGSPSQERLSAVPKVISAAVSTCGGFPGETEPGLLS